MKTLGVFFVAIVILSCGLNSAAQNANGCSSGMRTGIFYTDCWTDSGDDTSRLQSAVSTAAGSRLIFNESSYSVSDPIPVSSNTIIEGTAPGRNGSKSKITITSNSESIFSIGPDIYGVTIQDLGLEAGGGTSGSIGIAASGNTGQDASKHFHFHNLWFKGLDKGIYVYSNSPDYGWQFDDVHVDDSTFENCNYAIYGNTINSGWQLNNLLINSLDEQYGIWFERVGYASLNMVIGNAARASGIPEAKEFIRIKYHGVISIQNCSAEFYEKQLMIDDGGTEKNWAPIYLINNGFLNCPYSLGGNDQNQNVEINNSIVISTGNDYSCSDPDSGGGGVTLTRGPSRPRIRGTSDVTSIGDRFCKWGSTWCDEHVDTVPNPDVTYYASEFAVEGGVSTLNSFNPVKVGDYTTGLLSLNSGFTGKTLLELSNSIFYNGVVYKYKYAFMRNASDGWLEVEGNQDPPYVGYRFKKGPVQLTSSTQSNLSSHSAATSGSMLYCSDCTAPSTPCSGSGSGALALRVGSAWNCK